VIPLEHYFGTKVMIRFRWLEDDEALKQEIGVKSQNKIPSFWDKNSLRIDLKKVWKIMEIRETGISPFRRQLSPISLRTMAYINQMCCSKKGDNGEAAVFLDQLFFQRCKLLWGIIFQDGHRAYSVSEAEAIWRKVIVIMQETSPIDRGYFGR